jgi:hypothetical protein
MAKANRLQSPSAPNLPVAPTIYTPQHYDVFSNVLRLYFNRIDQGLTALFGDHGGSFLNIPFIAAYDSSNQYATGNNIPTAAIWSAGDYNGFALGATSAECQHSGIYKITYSLQFANTDNAVHDAIVWLRVNGTTSAADVPNSTTKFSIPARKSAGVSSFVVGYSEVVFQLNAGDTVSLWWGTTTAYNPVGPVDGVYIYAEAAQTTPMPYPAVPSALGSITFVSALEK